MTQESAGRCPVCQTPLVPGQRFCSNCGSVVEVAAFKPTERSYEESETVLPGYGGKTDNPPPPPPSSLSYGVPTPPSSSFGYGAPTVPPSSPGYGAPTVPPSYPASQAVSGQGQPLPAYTRPAKDTTGRVLGQIGCGVLAIIVLIVGLCAGGSYLAYLGISNAAKNADTTTGSGYGSNGSSGTTASATPTVTTVNTPAVIYAGVKISVVDIKQAAKFSDDQYSSTSWITRLDLSEESVSSKASYYNYGDAMHLVLPDKSVVATANSQQSSGPDTGVKRNSWVDFSIPRTVDVHQLVLRLGNSNQAQMDVPLRSNADVGKYQPKTIQPNKQTQYAGLTWTLTSATLAYSAQSTQADTGMRLVTLNLKMDNSSDNPFIKYSGDYMRLKAGAQTASQESIYDFPTSVNAHSTGTTGQIAFMVDQNVTSFTLILLGDQSNQVAQSSIDFQFV